MSLPSYHTTGVPGSSDSGALGSEARVELRISRGSVSQNGSVPNRRGGLYYRPLLTVDVSGAGPRQGGLSEASAFASARLEEGTPPTALAARRVARVSAAPGPDARVVPCHRAVGFRPLCVDHRCTIRTPTHACSGIPPHAPAKRPRGPGACRRGRAPSAGLRCLPYSGPLAPSGRDTDPTTGGGRSQTRRGMLRPDDGRRHMGFRSSCAGLPKTC